MTDVEITLPADEHLAALEAEPRERILQKLGEAQDWTFHRNSEFRSIR